MRRRIDRRRAFVLALLTSSSVAPLLTPAMLSPHESLVLSEDTGRLAAVFGNPGTNVGIVETEA